MKQTRHTDAFEYDVCLSFAGQQRGYVKEVASALRKGRVRVFFDEYERSDMWGKDLYSHLKKVYGSLARFCIMFTSADYATNLWTNHERQTAHQRAVADNKEYILPVRFDDTEIPGIDAGVAYIDARQIAPSELASILIKKLPPRSTQVSSVVAAVCIAAVLLLSVWFTACQLVGRLPSVVQRADIIWILLAGFGGSTIGGFIWNVLCRSLGWPYHSGGSGNEPHGIHAFVWGAITMTPIPVLAVTACCSWHVLLSLDFLGIVLIYMLAMGLGSIVFYDSGIRQYIERKNFSHGEQELIIVVIWSFVLSICPTVGLLALCPFLSALEPTCLFLQTSCSVALSMGAVSFFLLVFPPTPTFDQLRGWFAGFAIRMGLFWGLLMSLRG